MNVSDKEYKIYSAIVMSIREALEAARLFGLNPKQIVEFDIKQSIHMIRCCLEFPSDADEMIKLQCDVFARHWILIDVHDQILLDHFINLPNSMTNS
jgi:hypothetical protein